MAVGPEGGFAAAELEAGRAAGLQPVGLGGRILRAETAAIIAVALSLFLAGDLAGSGAGAGPLSGSSGE